MKTMALISNKKRAANVTAAAQVYEGTRTQFPLKSRVFPSNHGAFVPVVSKTFLEQAQNVCKSRARREVSRR